MHDEIAFSELNHQQSARGKGESTFPPQVSSRTAPSSVTPRCKQRSVAGNDRHFSVNCPASRAARTFSSALVLLIETDRPGQQREYIETRGFIENISPTHRTQLRHRSNPVDLFSIQCGIVLHSANTPLPLESPNSSGNRIHLSTRRCYPQLVHRKTTCSCRFNRSSQRTGTASGGTVYGAPDG